jgi:hypothetical protein
MGDWEKLEGDKNFWSPAKVGDVLEGVLVEINQGMYGSKFTIKTDKGNILTPSHRILQARLAKAQIGDIIKIVYQGTQPPKVRGENPLTLYDVFRKPGTDKPAEELVK